MDALSQSFVATPEDMHAVRQATAGLGCQPFLIAKIERAEALENLDAIIEAADGIMVARGDLGVEIPIEQIAVTQKRLMEKARRLSKPVITATQMLESLVSNRRPTRAEATDVANAILDGTDCVMLSAESAMGRYPVDAVAMLAHIAETTETHNAERRLQGALKDFEREGELGTVDLIAFSLGHTLRKISPRALIVQSRNGDTARDITRFRLPVWITAFSSEESICQALQFSYGVQPQQLDKEPPDWNMFARLWLQEHGYTDGLALMAQGPSPEQPYGNHRMEILELSASIEFRCNPDDGSA